MTITDVDLTAACLIGGRWVPGSGTDAIDVFNPATGQVITELVPATIEDAEAAVVAASRAFAEWGSRPLSPLVWMRGGCGSRWGCVWR